MNQHPFSVGEIIRQFREDLTSQYGEKEVMQFLYLLFDAWKGWTRAQIHLESGQELDGEEAARFLVALQDLRNNKPIQYIIGETEFHGLRIRVNPHVLIPRPETEELVALIEKLTGDIIEEAPAIVDLCTGSGCIAISLKKRFSAARVVAVDISAEALEVAGENALLNGCAIELLQADIKDDSILAEHSGFRLIVSNPPYVPESEKRLMEKNVLDYEPAIALFVPDDDPLLYYRIIADFARKHLSGEGELYFEIHENFADEVSKLLQAKGFTKVETFRDMHQRNRFVKAGF